MPENAWISFYWARRSFWQLCLSLMTAVASVVTKHKFVLFHSILEAKGSWIWFYWAQVLVPVSQPGSYGELASLPFLASRGMVFACVGAQLHILKAEPSSLHIQLSHFFSQHYLLHDRKSSLPLLFTK